MDPQQTPRAPEDPVSGRGSAMAKQNLSAGIRPQGPVPLTPRYPVNNGSAGGARPAGQQILHRLDSRSSLGSPTGPPGGQFPQQRPLFGPRPQNPQGNSPARPPPNQQGPLRYPGTPPGVRPPPNHFPGQRPPIFNPNQPQQIYYQPRNGELRLQRPIILDPQNRFPAPSQNPEPRQTIPETVVTPPPSTHPRNDLPLRDGRVNGQPTASPIVRPQPAIRQPRTRMEVVDSRTPTPGAQSLEAEENGKRVTRSENEDDDDDVIMDKESVPSKPGTPMRKTPQPETPRNDSPDLQSRVSPHKKSPSPMSDRDRPASSTEVENPSPLPDRSHSIADDDSGDFLRNEMEARASEEKDSTVIESRSPVPPRTPDNPANLSVPQNSSSTSSTPPKSPKSPAGSVKGFDNGQLRSLSPKPPTPSPGLPSPSPPSSPTVVKANVDGHSKEPSISEESSNAQNPDNEETVKSRAATPASDVRGKSPAPSTEAVERARTPGTPDGRKSASIKRSTSGRSIKSDAGSDSGSNQMSQVSPTTNGVALSPTKRSPPKSRNGEKRSTAGSPVKSPSKSVKSLPKTPDAGPPSTADKKVPMNKVQVGAAPSPNLKTVRSKIGSLDNASYKPGGGKVKIENRKLDFSKAQPKIAAKNDKYTPSGGDKKITQVKLQWNAKPKVGSLDNATYKPGGGDKKIETVKLDFKDKAKPKVGSKDNAKHMPGGGTIKSTSTPPKTPQEQPNHIETQKIDIKAESKVGSLDNVKHKPGGGEKKIFNDRDYLRQTCSNVESLNGSGAQSPVPSNAISDGKNGLPTSDENLNEEC